MGKLRIPVLLVLFSAAAAIEAFRLTSLSSLNNADIWWHLGSGLWMLQHHALPHTGIFSQASAQPWIAANWAYEWSLAIFYKAFGLAAIPLFLMAFKTVLAVLTFVLAGGMQGRFWAAVALSAVTQFVLGGVQPGPVYLSILFFGIELLLLLQARQRRSVRLLWWLPVLFLVWANVHVQFVYGLAVLFCFVLATALESRMAVAVLPLPKVASIFGVSVIATIVTPYFCRPYAVFLSTTFNSANRYLPDFQALGFRQAQDYLLLLLAMSAFLALGLRQSREAFQISALAFALGLSFYSQRDIWVVTLVAVAILGEALSNQERTLSADQMRKLRRQWWIAASAAVALALAVFALRVPRGREALLAKVSTSYPVAACDSIRGHRFPQPMFNAYEWGGFLSWCLPEYPVAIDSRTELYGGDIVTEYSKVMNAEVPYTEYSAVADAETIVLPKKANMAVALSSVPRFQVAYSDDVAVVLTRRSTP